MERMKNDCRNETKREGGKENEENGNEMKRFVGQKLNEKSSILVYRHETHAMYIDQRLKATAFYCSWVDPV